MAAYDESFWVFVGTTGPIVALANVVTFGQATDAVALLRVRDRRSVPVPGENRVRTEFFRLLRRGHIYFVGLSFAFSRIFTTLSAFALWERENIIAGPWVIALIITAFALLFILGACSAALTRRLSALREFAAGDEEEQPTIGAASSNEAPPFGEDR
jgi:hypothetical protein